MCVCAQTNNIMVVQDRIRPTTPEFRRQLYALQCRARVLYVDDDEDSREMLCVLLRSSRIEVEAVSTAAQALSSIQIEHFNLYLLGV
jgi:PleD family two-component response regulator